MVLLKEFLPQVGSKTYDFEIIEDSINIIDEAINRKIDFVVNNDNELLFGFGHFKLNKKCRELIMAGEMIINEDGKITYINNNSGHYKPNRNEFNLFIKEFVVNLSELISNDFQLEFIDWKI
jgi:hypothetical protein